MLIIYGIIFIIFNSTKLMIKKRLAIILTEENFRSYIQQYFSLTFCQILKKSVHTNGRPHIDALIARLGAWPIESPKILLVNAQHLHSRSKECYTLIATHFFSHFLETAKI